MKKINESCIVQEKWTFAQKNLFEIFIKDTIPVNGAMMPLVLGHLLLDQSQGYHLVVGFEIYYMQSETSNKRIVKKQIYKHTKLSPKYIQIIRLFN